ncbi:MAG: DNA-3-methyladenine glycosylase [Leptolyngbya sp. DLM2.Bin15]|nr:MAG: DNA-3-methyladenine glycosylase [Leptolyngbya sp. DLM2.Bin15]
MLLPFSPSPLPPISAAWLARPSPAIAVDLLGCTLVRQFEDGSTLRSLIVETEAYAPDDPACHAYRRRTPRNAVMFGPAGYSYVYLIYGMYHCLNVVTDAEDVPSAVLIRAVQLQQEPPGDRSPQPLARLGAGPGKLCRALQIDRSHSGQPFAPGQPLWLEQRSPSLDQQMRQGAIALHQTTRIGLTQGADSPWRWYIRDSAAVSKR